MFWWGIRRDTRRRVGLTDDISVNPGCKSIAIPSWGLLSSVSASIKTFWLGDGFDSCMPSPGGPIQELGNKPWSIADRSCQQCHRSMRAATIVHGSSIIVHEGPGLIWPSCQLILHRRSQKHQLQFLCNTQFRKVLSLSFLCLCSTWVAMPTPDESIIAAPKHVMSLLQNFVSHWPRAGYHCLEIPSTRQKPPG